MLRSVPIRRKLALALAAPLVIANAVSLFGMYQSRRSADRLGAQAQLATAALGPGGLITGLRLEGSLSAVVLIGLPPSALGVGSLPSVRTDVDREVAALGPFVRSHGAATAIAYQPVFTALDHIASYRAQVDGFKGARSLSSGPAIALSTSMVGGYDQIIQTILDADTQLIGGISDPVLRNGTELLDSEARSSQVSGMLTTTLGGLAETGKPITPADEQSLAEQYGELQTLLGRSAQLATGVFADAAPRSQDAFLQTIRNAIAGKSINILNVVSSALGNGSKDPANTASTNAAATTVTSRARDLQRGARRDEEAYAGLAVLSLLVAYGSTLIAGRSITEPLHDLTSQAEELAAKRLPATVDQLRSTPIGQKAVRPDLVPVTSKSRDEFGELAAALNLVQTSAVDLAIEQAELRSSVAESFVDLGRRNQNLIARQLDGITELERDETDPEVLANLFRLDHNATRMRRNAESLLVLAGLDPARRWTQPVLLADVVRAALAEVEDYQRVNIRNVKGFMVTGSAAADLAHLLAELIENALVYSSPETTVEILGRSFADGYALSVVDEGIGMSTEDRARANARLAGTEAFMATPSRYLGHRVSGLLAARLGVVVTLHEGPTKGTVARLILPASVLVAESAASPVPAAAPPAVLEPVGATAGRTVVPSIAPPVTVGPPAALSVGPPAAWPVDPPGAWPVGPPAALSVQPPGAVPIAAPAAWAQEPVTGPADPRGDPAVTRSGLRRRVRTLEPVPAGAPSIPRADEGAGPTDGGSPQDALQFLARFREAVPTAQDSAVEETTP